MILLSADISAIKFAEERQKAANEYEWLYQCTSKNNFLNILKSREFWLSNLKDVNDKEEASRIDVPEYENKIYIASFTYDKDISSEHWAEYSDKIEDAILFGVKKEWFIRDAIFMDANNIKCDGIYEKIEKNYDIAYSVKNKSNMMKIEFVIRIILINLASVRFIMMTIWIYLFDKILMFLEQVA